MSSEVDLTQHTSPPAPPAHPSGRRGTAAEAVIRTLVSHPLFGDDTGFHLLSGNAGSNEGPLWQAIQDISGLKGLVHAPNEFLAACMASGFEVRANANDQGLQKIPVLALHAQVGVKYAAAGFDFLDRQRQPCLLLVGDAGTLARHYGGHNSVADYRGLLRELGVKSVHVPVDENGAWVHDPQRMLAAVAEAMVAVMSEPYGLVAVILDEDLLNSKTGLEPLQVSTLPAVDASCANEIATAAELLCTKRKPVVVLNQEVGRSSGARRAAEELARLIGARVVACYAPGTIFDRGHESWCGNLSFGDADDVERQMHGYAPDAVVVVGGPFPNNVWPNGRSGVPAGVPTVVISPDPTDRHRCNIDTSVWCCANVGWALSELVRQLDMRRERLSPENASAHLQLVANANRAALEARIAEYEKHLDETPIHPGRIARELVLALKARADSGKFRLADVAIFDEALTSSRPFLDYVQYYGLRELYYYGTPGPTLGAHGGSLGFQVAKPSGLVVSLFGDGGADFNDGAFIASARENIPVKHLLIDNGGYELVSLNFARDAKLRGENERGQFEAGCVRPLHTQRRVHQNRALQVRGFVERSSGTPAFGSEYVELPLELGPAIGRMLDSKGPFLLQVIAQGTHFQPRKSE